jgi:hypothetical protein
MTVIQSQETSAVLAPCHHDSTRIDGALDHNCLKCGLEGYWHDGHRHDRYHPSFTKVLFVLDCEQAKTE